MLSLFPGSLNLSLEIREGSSVNSIIVFKPTVDEESKGLRLLCIMIFYFLEVTCLCVCLCVCLFPITCCSLYFDIRYLMNHVMYNRV